MSITEKLFDEGIDGTNRVFSSDVAIKGELYVRVFTAITVDNIDTWTMISSEDYGVINDNVVFDVAPTADKLTLQVATTPEELTANPTDVTLVASMYEDLGKILNNEVNINKVANIDTDVTKVANIDTDVTKVANIDTDVTKVAYALGGNYLVNYFTDRELILRNTEGTEGKIFHKDGDLDKEISVNSIVTYVDNIEDLALNPNEGDVCIVKDLIRGGTFVYYDAFKTVNDDGIIINGWGRQYSGYVNVKWFNVKGDGVTDDYVKIQYLLDTGLSLFFPKGTYRCNTELVVTKRNTAIRMQMGNDGDSTTSIDSYASTGFGLRFSVLVGDIDGAYYENVRINMNGLGSGAVDAGQLSFATFINCSFATAGKIGQEAFRIRGDDNGSGAYYNTFLGCSFACTGVAFKSLNSFALRLYETSLGATPNSNTFIGCRSSGGAVGIRISGNNNSFYNPILESNGVTAIQFVGAKDNTRCLDNIVMNPRVEGTLTSSVIAFGTYARANRVYAGHITSFGSAQLISDSSDGSNSWDLNTEVVRGNLVESYKISDLINITNSTNSFKANELSFDENKVQWKTGSGSPEGTIDAGKGSIYTNQSASSASTLLYVKTTPVGTLTGWVAK